MNLSAPLSVLALVIFALVSVVIPLVSSLLLKQKWVTTHPEVGGVVTLILATITGLLTKYLDSSGPFNWHAGLSTAFVSLIIAFQSRSHIWRGSAADAKALAVGSHAAAVAAPTPPV